MGDHLTQAQSYLEEAQEIGHDQYKEKHNGRTMEMYVQMSIAHSLISLCEMFEEEFSWRRRERDHMYNRPPMPEGTSGKL